MEIYYRYEVDVYLKKGKHTSFFFPTFTDAIKCAHDHSFGNKKLTTIYVSSHFKNGDHGGEIEDDFCSFRHNSDGSLTLVIAGDSVISNIPQPTNEKMSLVKGELIPAVGYASKKRLQEKQTLNLATPVSIGYEYDAHIVDFDENGNKRETVKAFSTKNYSDLALNYAIGYFYDTYNFDPKKYVSYEIYNVIKQNNFEDFIMSFDIGKILNLGGWKIDLS